MSPVVSYTTVLCVLCFVEKRCVTTKKNVVEQSNSVVSPNGNQVSTMSFGNGQHCQIFQKSFFP